MMSDFQVDMNEYLPLRDVVFHTLRRAILRGELKPGERLMEIALSERLGVSRTPVREAIRMLEQEGLVLMIPRRGAQVAQITEKDLRDVLEVRMGLEELAVRFACGRITEEELGELEEAIRSFDAARKSGDLGAMAREDVKFHDVIYRATHNQRLIQIINNIGDQMFRYRIEYLKEDDVRDMLVGEHIEIFQAIRDGDADAAVRHIREHIAKQQDAILRSLEE